MNKDNYSLRFSPRGMPLVYCEPPCKQPVLTVENYLKWYELFLVLPDGSVQAIDFPYAEEFCQGESPCHDHVPNPRVVMRAAVKYGWMIDRCGLEMIIGRWELERFNSPWSED